MAIQLRHGAAAWAVWGDARLAQCGLDPDRADAIVWRADYLPFGEVRTSSGPASLAYRFPGQWFMLETGLHYNWHRWYDASMGRYTQPDPIGMPDGPSRYAYALNSPLMYFDPDGQSSAVRSLPTMFESLFRKDQGGGGGSGGGGGGGICPMPDDNEWISNHCRKLYELCDMQRWGGPWFCDECLRKCIAQREWPFDLCSKDLPQSRPNTKFPPKKRKR